jgi:hypothetical protein
LLGDPVTEGFELANVVALLAFWVGMGVVVAGVEVVKLDGLVAQQVPDDDQDGTTYRDDGFLLAAAAGDAPVAFAQERVGLACSDGGLAQDPGQVAVPVPGGSGALLATGGLFDLWGEPGSALPISRAATRAMIFCSS